MPKKEIVKVEAAGYTLLPQVGNSDRMTFRYVWPSDEEGCESLAADFAHRFLTADGVLVVFQGQVLHSAT